MGNIHSDINTQRNNYLFRFGRFGWQFGFDQTEDLLGLVRFFSIREPTKPNLTGHQPGMKVYHSNKLGSVCTELPNQLPNKNSVR